MSRAARSFTLAGLLALLAAAGLHLLALLGFPNAWGAMVHLTLFGWISGLILAVNYHMVPVFSGRDFAAPRLTAAHVALFALGLPLAAAGLLLGLPALTGVGIALQLVASLLFSANIALLFRRGSQRPFRPLVPPIPGQPEVDRVGARATRLAGMCLPLALALLLGASQGWMIGEWWLAAEHLAAVGWTMLMIVGVAYHTLPRFTGRGTRGPRWARIQLAGQVAAVALMVPALGFGWGRVFAAGGLLMAAALGLFAWTIWPTIGRRSSASAVCRSPLHIPLEEQTR